MINPCQSNDLEAIVFLLELAAIELTSEPNAEFTLKELISRAQEIGEPDLHLKENDAMIVLKYSKFLKKKGNGHYCLK